MPYLALSVISVLMLLAGILPAPTPVAVAPGGWAGWDNIAAIAVLPASDEFLYTAAQELKAYLTKMSGRPWQVVYGDVDRPSVRIDVDPDLPALADRGDEAVWLSADMDGVRIVGKTSLAARHGAYILLEKVGVRWFFKHPAWEVVPSSLADLQGLDEVQEPFYFWRFIWNAESVGMDRTSTWRMRNRLYGASFYPVHHSYAMIADRSLYSAHPDWFLPAGSYPGYPWQLDPENPEILARAIEFARNWLSRPPSAGTGRYDVLPIGSVPISPNDGRGWDPPYGSDYQSITDKVFYLANEVAKAVKSEFPEKYVALYAYSLYAGIPTFDLEPNLLVEIATDFNSTPLTLAEQIKGFKSKGVEVGIRDYLDVWTWSKDSATINYDRIKRLSWYASQGIKVYDGESGDGWGGHGGLTNYLASQLLWDPSRSVESLLDDFYSKAFGPAKQPMKHYYEVRNTTAEALAEAFRDLAGAEIMASGNDQVLERIRQLEYYTRYVWLWKNVGITNLSLEDLKGFYTFITKVRDLYLVFYRFVEDGLRNELRARGLSDSQINALQDFTPPTAQEARAMLDDALSAFGQTAPLEKPLDPLKTELEPLGDTTAPKLQPLYGRDRQIAIPSQGNEDVTVMVKGYSGVLQWYSPTKLILDSWSFSPADNLVDWTPVVFHAELPGTYVLHVTRALPAASERVYVDVPNRPASIIADSSSSVFKPGEWLPMDAPSYLGHNEVYFYVPENTGSFSFGADVSTTNPERHAQGSLTDPNGAIYPFDFGVTTEITLGSPAPGVWKAAIDMPVNSGHFWLSGIPPLVWHDARNLLVPTSYDLGDVNVDGVVDGLDVTHLEHVIMGFPGYDYTNYADANRDVELNALDVTGVETILMSSGSPVQALLTPLPMSVSPATIPDQVPVRIEGPPHVVEGETYSARISTGAVTDLDTAQYDISYDPSVIKVTGVTSGLVGDTAMPVSMWGFVPPWKQGKIRVIQNAEGVTGITGPEFLAEVHFEVVGAAGDSSVYAVGNALLGDKNAREIASTPTNGSVQVIGAIMAGDVDGNGTVDLADLLAVTAAFGTSPPLIPAADLNGDGVVNFLDLVLAGWYYGSHDAAARDGTAG